jgi:hypothetical protein
LPISGTSQMSSKSFTEDYLLSSLAHLTGLNDP